MNSSTENSLRAGYEIFPIKSPTACLLKWAWSTVDFNKKWTSSCHRSTFHDLTLDNLASFHNLPGKIQEREQMIEGQWPSSGGCEYCHRIERVGGISDRMTSLSQEHQADKIPPELYQDPSATTVSPIILEVCFDNACNLSCIYCTPRSSSKINDELRKFGDIELPGFRMRYLQPDHDLRRKMIDELWNHLSQGSYKHLRHFNVQGGEPFVQKELDSAMEFWRTHPNPNLEFNIISNLNIDPARFKHKVDEFKTLIDDQCIFRLALTASLDCWGDEQVYLRHGLDLDVWQENFEYLLDKDWIHVSLHSCLSILSVKTAWILVDRINRWNLIRPADLPIDWSFDVVLGKENMLPGIVGPGVIDGDLEKIINYLPERTNTQRGKKTQMLGVAQHVRNSQKNPDKIYILKEYLNELDRRRSTDWKTVFPWLAGIN